MTKRSHYRADKVRDVEPGQSFTVHTGQLLASDAWRKRSIHCTRLLDRLEMEHQAHSGTQNGYLIVTYDQFVEYGIGRRFIRKAIREAQDRKLLVVERYGGYRGGARRQPSLYRLTYLKFRVQPAIGRPYIAPPTNDWRHYDEPPAKSNRMVTTGEPSRFTSGVPKRCFRKSANVLAKADYKGILQK